MYDDGKPVNFPGTPMAYKQKVPPIEVKSEAGVKGKEEWRLVTVSCFLGAHLQILIRVRQKILRMLTYKR